MTLIRLEDVTLEFSLKGKIARVPGRSKKPVAAESSSVGAKILFGYGRAAKTRPLDGLSIKINSGERVGLIGHNGAGKTTLLRVLSGTLDPQFGSVQIEGTVTSMLSLSGSMNLQMSGYENIVQRALWLNHSMKTIENKIADICEFSELGDYIHADVSVYSAGMISRLLFSTVTAFEPEILLLDEGMIVGDERFQRKARKRMEEYTGRANIIVVASHSQEMLKSICTHVLWLHKGKKRQFGPTQNVLDAYNNSGMQEP